MRKFILIAAMILVSATAEAEQSRSLITASAEPTASETPKTAQAATPAATTETAKFVERPAAVDATTPAEADSCKPTPRTAKIDTKTDKPRHKKYWTEARIVGELHRHGIYW